MTAAGAERARICAILFTLNLTAAAQVMFPVNGGTPTLNPVTINNGAGDQ